MNAPVRDIGTCDECGKGLPYRIYDTDWMFEAEPVYPCDNCGKATCGEFHTEVGPWTRDGEGGGWPAAVECPGCREGAGLQATVAYEYAQSRGV